MTHSSPRLAICSNTSFTFFCFLLLNFRAIFRYEVNRIHVNFDIQLFYKKTIIQYLRLTARNNNITTI